MSSFTSSFLCRTLSFSSLLLSCFILPFPPFFPPSFLIFSPTWCLLLQEHLATSWSADSTFVPSIVYPFTPSLFPSISSWLCLRSLPFSFLLSIPTASEFPNLFPCFVLFPLPPSLPPSLILASQWPYSSLVLSCPAKIRWCPTLWTPYYWAELAILQKPTSHMIPTALGGYNLNCISPLCLPSLSWLRPRLIHRPYFWIELWLVQLAT